MRSVFDYCVSFEFLMFYNLAGEGSDAVQQALVSPTLDPLISKVRTP